MTFTSACPRCGGPVYADDRFCAACGVMSSAASAADASLTRATVAAATAGSFCPRCGEPVLAGDNFCGQCGAEQPSEASKRIVNAPPRSAGWSQILDRLREATLGEYDVLGEIGRGGMAAVYLAHEIALNRKVAIKVMSPGFLLDATMIERFRREAVTSASLRHPNIVTIHAVRTTELLHYFVMEYVEGQPLDVIVKEHGPLPVSLIQALLFQVGNAVFYAHTRGVIHRDIKPANIMISTEGEAVVMDFGIAKAGEWSGTSHTIGAIGTPAYMSPEQCHAEPLTAASDQYSLGVVLYEMLTGRPPFSGSALAVQIAHTSTPPLPIRQLRPEAPARLAEAVHRMLAKAPAERWPDVGEAISACGAMPMGARDPSRTEIARLAGTGTGIRREPVRTPMSPRPGSAAASDPALQVVTAVSIQPLDEPLRLGDSVRLQARVAARTGETLPGRVVNWSSGQPAVASVSADGTVRAVAIGETVITARSEGVSGSLTIAVLPPIPADVALASPDHPLEVGSSVTLPFQVLDRHARRIEGQTVSWLAAPPGVVAVSDDGRVTALAEGRATVRARCGNAEGICELVVVPIPVAAVAIDGLPATLLVGETTRVTATVVDQAGRALVNRPVEWRTDPPSVAGVSAGGMLSAWQPGRVTVVAACEGVTATAVVEVLRPRAARVVMGPVPPSLELGSELDCRAVAYDASGREIEDAGFEWGCSDPGVARVAPEGVVQAVGVGDAVVWVRCDEAEASAPIAVLAPAVATGVGAVAEPAAVPSAAGAELRRTGLRRSIPGLAAVGAAGMLVAALAWLALRGPADATPARSEPVADAVDSVPVAEAAAEKPPTPPVTEADSAPAPAVAEARIVLTLPSREILPGDTIDLVARLRTPDGRTRPLAPEWTTGAPAVLRPIGRSGRAVAVGAGRAVLTARAPEAAQPATASLSVSSPRVDRIELVGVPDSLTVGETAAAMVRTYDQRGRSIAAPVAWQSSAPARAAVNDRGQVSALAAGNAEIRVRAGSRTATRPIRVLAPRVTATVTPPPPVIPPPSADSVDAAAAQQAARVIVGTIVGWFRQRRNQDIEASYRPVAGGPTARALLGFLGDVEAADVQGEPALDLPGSRVSFTLRLEYRDLDRRRESIDLRGLAMLGRAGAGWELRSFSLVGRLP